MSLTRWLAMSKRYKISPVVSYYWRHVRQYTRLVWGIVISVPVTILINGYLPTLIIANIIGLLSQHHYQPEQLLPTFGPYLVLYAILALTGMGLWRIVDYFM